MHLYKCLSLSTKHFISRSSSINPVFQQARFERVVKMAGKSLTTNIYNSFLYIEESQQAEMRTQQAKKKKDSNVLRSKVLRDTKLIPKVVYELEYFAKCVMSLSTKTKVDLTKFIGQGTARDFRIQMPALKEVLEQMDRTEEDEIEEEENEQTDEDNDDEKENDSDSEQPKPKKKKTKK